MKEIHDILRAYQEATAAGIRTALATVVEVEGSSYRRPGARMLVTETGNLTGAISGGCLEGDALRKALLALQQNRNKLVTYNSMDEEDHQFGIQLGCNGIVHIFFEPIHPGLPANPIALLQKAAHAEIPSVLATVFNLQDSAGSQTGTCCWLNGTDLVVAPSFSCTPDLRNRMALVLESGRSSLAADETTALLQYIPPPAELVIAGAGNDAQPLATMAALLGWRITVLDGRKTHATAARFPQAQRILVGKPPEVLKDIVIGPQTVFVLMSHNYPYDRDMLAQLLNSSSPYIGVLGPRKKSEQLLRDLTASGISVPDASLQSVYAPTGLQIGAETAEEIALSIIAEIKAVLSGRQGGHLRDSRHSIHEHFTPPPAIPVSG